MSFNDLALRLEKNVYDSPKGFLRLSLLTKDLEEFIPGFKGKEPLSILDAGGGAGHFSRICAANGHNALLCDTSPGMLELAQKENRKTDFSRRIQLLNAPMDAPAVRKSGPFDLVLLHGAAEWTSDPAGSIRSMMMLIKPSGFLSLLVFNKDKLLLKKGINGHLVRPVRKRSGSGKLLPPGGLSAEESVRVLTGPGSPAGTILLQSGIRIFQGFFRQCNPPEISDRLWLEQEETYYRRPPFNNLGEHTHFIWQNKK